MKGKNYNLELIRMVSFVLVIAIHVTNYFCRAYGKIPQGEYLLSSVTTIPQGTSFLRIFPLFLSVFTQVAGNVLK